MPHGVDNAGYVDDGPARKSRLDTGNTLVSMVTSMKTKPHSIANTDLVYGYMYMFRTQL